MRPAEEISVFSCHPALPGRAIPPEEWGSSSFLETLCRESKAPFTLLYCKPARTEWAYLGLERLLQTARDTGAGMIYADHYRESGVTVRPFPCIDYQKGALRDDFAMPPSMPSVWLSAAGQKFCGSTSSSIQPQSSTCAAAEKRTSTT